jgi:dethiobiotin synthetase/adenosylmethionine--8-amino-7-oxononanoate aminotransferase
MSEKNSLEASITNAFCIVGANTGVGKTLVSAGLAAAFQARGAEVVRYVKPWQTGAPQDFDERTVRRAVAWRQEKQRAQVSTSRVGILEARTMVAYAAPVSPHVAARSEGLLKTDEAVFNEVRAFLREQRAQDVFLLEGAGGVASPTPEGALQCDVLQPLGLSAVLVGCSKLGGISATLAAFECLQMRGFHVAALLFLGHDLGVGNASFVAELFEKRRHVLSDSSTASVPHVAVVGPSQGADVLGFEGWLQQSMPAFDTLAFALASAEADRTLRTRTMAEQGEALLWWPFTQHATVENVGVIERACGDDIVFAGEGSLFDACASWWTQSLGHGRDDLAQEAATAAGRFGHVMFPGNVHEPAVALARALIKGVGEGWAERVFYSDNGSTAAEVALKMAFRLRLSRGVDTKNEGRTLRVLGLRDSYHGDTMGVMDAASPNVFNAREPWYQGRGVWLPFPVVSFNGTAWTLTFGEDYVEWLGAHASSLTPLVPDAALFPSRESLFAPQRHSTPLAHVYERAVRSALDALDTPDAPLGALLLEPVVHGSGGMLFVDPLFQAVLACEAKARGIPVVFDEVFVGFWRLGFARAADALGVSPDIACYSKSVTGGLVPLGVTLATAEVFRCFLGASKAEALLHGHSFTAYPIGCAVAARAVAAMKATARVQAHSVVQASTPWVPFCAFSDEGLASLAALPGVSRVWALGTVFAGVWGADAGYTGTGAADVVKKLRARGVYARTLGNVFYGMTTLETTPEKASWLLERYLEVLREG